MNNVGSSKVETGSQSLATALATDEAWSEMLSKVGGKLCKLDEFVEAYPSSRPSTGRQSLLLELEKERVRIGRELHAGAGQPLSGIKLNLEILHELAAEFPASAKQALVRLESLAEQALQQIRAVSHRLHPPDWQQLSTAAAIRNLIATCGLEAHYELYFEAEEMSREPHHLAKVALYRCAQECLSNIVRHAGATAIRIQLFEDNDFVRLEISDNGCGFETGTPGAKFSGGIGLNALKEHASGAGGSCRVSSGISGTTIRVCIPFDEDE